LVAPLIAACVFLLVRGGFTAAGVALAVATVKPQITWPIAVWLLLWSTSSLRERWKFIVAFFVTLGVLILAAESVLPGWIHEFLPSVKAYLEYNPSRTLLDGLLGHPSAVVVEFVLVAIAAVTAWRARPSEADSEEFSFATALV